MTNLEAALEYRRAGVSVIPVPPGQKEPVIRWKEFQERLATEDEIRSWFSNPDTGVGIITGPISGIFVVDFDGDDGQSTLHNLGISSPIVSLTGKGRHLFFKYPSDDRGNTVRRLPGMDTRGKGGYVLAPPSKHPSGRQYRWENEGLKLVPALLPELPVIKELDQVKVEPAPAIEGDIIEGGRNNAMASLAGSMRRRGMSEEGIFQALKTENTTRCKPPLDEEEIRTIARSYARYKPAFTLGSNDGSLNEPKQNDESECGDSISGFLSETSKIDWLVSPFFSYNSMGFVTGLPETCKTWMMMDLAVSIAAADQKLWMDRFTVNNGKVLFIDQERFKGETQRRFSALLNGNGINPDDLKDKLFVRAGKSTKIDMMSSLTAFKRELSKIRPDVVIIDSFATFHSASDTSRQEIQAVLEIIKILRQEFKCSFLFIHHENKMAFQEQAENKAPSFGTMAGSIAIPAAAESIMTVVKHGTGKSMVYHTKSTMASPNEAFMVTVKDLNDSKTAIKVVAS